MYNKIHNVHNNVLQYIKYQQYNIYLSHNIFIIQMITFISTWNKMATDFIIMLPV